MLSDFEDNVVAVFGQKVILKTALQINFYLTYHLRHILNFVILNFQLLIIIVSSDIPIFLKKS